MCNEYLTKTQVHANSDLIREQRSDPTLEQTIKQKVFNPLCALLQIYKNHIWRRLIYILRRPSPGGQFDVYDRHMVMIC